MRTLLVTGGAGFIGANFVHYWMRQHQDDRVVVLDALTYAGNRANLDPVDGSSRFHFVHGEIGDFDLVSSLLAEHSIDTIVHFAAESHVDRSIAGPDRFIEANVLGTHTLLKAARSVWADRNSHEGSTAVRFHHVSTDEVYGSLGATDPAFSETTPYAPNSPYAATKAGSDHLVRAYHHTYGLPVTTTNCSNNYGPYQFPEKLIPLTIVNMLDGKPVPVYGDGRNVRDWLHVEDHCRGVESVLLHGRTGETYNIGGNNERANIDLIHLIGAEIDLLFRDLPPLVERFPNAPAALGARSTDLITFVTDRPGHDRRYAIDACKITRELRYSPTETVETGIRRTVRWYIDNEPWWRAVMDGSYQRWIADNYAERLG
ncbi:MAG TPA: dTDP-glucose 4,6-dehydratase [Gemmatimonadaceae bacterium]|nr:dTDP-glucose 4,6-dehydratase [Gemmatimonadaceae bacterium]